MKQLNRQYGKTDRRELPVRVLQFGEGNFLRGFIDWMIDGMNDRGLFNGRISVVQPLPGGMADVMDEQDCLYTLVLRGIEKGILRREQKIITAVERTVNPYEEFDAYLREAENPELRIIVSNTTEAGIVLRREDRPGDRPPVSFPAKLLLLMKRRFDHFRGDREKGFLVFPCELIEKNGESLRKVLLTLAEEWYDHEPAFIQWIKDANTFFNTLVDRIVSGYPREEIEEMWKEAGYEDRLLDTAEIFHFFAVEGPRDAQREFPLVQGGFNVRWCDDLRPYRTRKVRILNGAHTMTVLAAWLYGLETVQECMDDPLVSAYIRKGLFEEIIPTLDLPEEELREYGEAVLERFGNPYIRHFLLSISLNSVSKFRTRVLPSLLEYRKRRAENPALLSFSLSALVLFYRPSERDSTTRTALRALDGEEYEINDSPDVLEFFHALWKEWDCDSPESAVSMMRAVLGHEEFWGQNLSPLDGLADLTGAYLYKMNREGLASLLSELTGVEK